MMKKTQVKALSSATHTSLTNKRSSAVKRAFDANVHAVVRVAKSGVNKTVNLTLVLGLLLGSVLSFITSSPAYAAACAAATTDLGTLTLPINVPANATYTIWNRIMAPDTTNNSVNLEVDGTTCFNVGGGSIAANTWTWVKHTDGNTSSIASMALTAGNHTFKYIGTKPGLSLDAVYLTSDASCTPKPTDKLADVTNTCPSGDSTGPTVSIVSPTNNQSVSGSVAITATASDPSGVKQVDFMVDGTTVNSDTSSPYSYNWDSSTATNGTHTLTAKAVDNANNETVSSAVTVTVGGGTAGKKGDVNGDGNVNITDLSLLLSNWGKTAPSPAAADVNGDGKVNITDLSLLLGNWGK